MAKSEHKSMFYEAERLGHDGADLRGLDLTGILGQSSKLNGALLNGANLQRADISGAYLQRADLSQANLSRAKITTADLREANLTGANLKSANLHSSVLNGAKFVDADLQKCQLTKAMITDVDFRNANLKETDLRGVRGATVEQIKRARNWEAAIYDKVLADHLGLTVNEELSRHGRKSPRKKTDPLVVDVRVRTDRLVFGDVFAFTGDVHPEFPPSDKFDLTEVEKLKIEQVGDYFAILRRGDEVLELWPIQGTRSVCHHPGPFDGVRLVIHKLTESNVKLLLKVVTVLNQALRGELEIPDPDGRAGVAITGPELETLCRSRIKS